MNATFDWLVNLSYTSFSFNIQLRPRHAPSRSLSIEEAHLPLKTGDPLHGALEWQLQWRNALAFVVERLFRTLHLI